MILIINNHDPNTQVLKKILKKEGIQCITRDQTSNLQNVDKKKIRGVIFSGGWGPALQDKTDMTKVRASLQVLLNYDVPVLGICEGHEVIGRVYGGDIYKQRKKVKEELEITIKKKGKLFKGIPDKIIAHESHSYQVGKLPPDFITTASSKRTKIEAMEHTKKKIYSVQFHPESSGMAGEKILRNFLDICKKA